MNPSSNPAVVFAVQRLLLSAQIEALRKLIQPLLESTMGVGEPEKEYMRLLGVVCDQMILSIGDSNPAFSELVSAEIEKMKNELRKRA